MRFVAECIQDSLPIWEQCLNVPRTEIRHPISHLLSFRKRAAYTDRILHN